MCFHHTRRLKQSAAGLNRSSGLNGLNWLNRLNRLNGHNRSSGLQRVIFMHRGGPQGHVRLTLFGGSEDPKNVYF